MDRRGVKWRKMKEINVVDINYKHTTYAGWKPVKSGLNSAVTLMDLSARVISALVTSVISNNFELRMDGSLIVCDYNVKNVLHRKNNGQKTCIL